MAHRSEILEYSKRYRESHREALRERAKLWRDSHREVYRERGREYFKRWRSSHLSVHRSIRFAQYHVLLGSCCEFCGSVDDLMRFHPDYGFPRIVVTVCRKCRSWIIVEVVEGA